MSRIFSIVVMVLTPVSNLSFSQISIEWEVSPLAVDCDGPSDNQGFSWFKNEFNDSLWQNVLLPHGIGQNTSADRFYRGKFTLNEIPKSLELFVSSDDGLWVYVNGNFVDHWGGECHEIGCVNEPLCGGSNTDIGSINISSYLQTGTNIIAAHVSNCSCQGGMNFNALLLNDILPVRLPGGNYYQLVLEPRLSWQTAYESAQSARYLDLSGHLATITSREEDLFLESWRKSLLLNRSPDAYEFWIGGFQSSDETAPQDGWQWVNNEGPIQGFNNGIQYSNWFNGEPNDYGRTPNIEDNEEDHMAVGFFGFGWNDNDQYLRSIYGYIIEYEISQENQPPQITHTPITSALRGKEILFSMEVTDDKNQLKTLIIYARVAGERDFTPYPIGVSPGQTMYDKGISGLTQTLDGVEYYIEATDAQGLIGYHRSDDGAHFICVTDPNKKTPVIIIPGIMGSELRDADTNDLIWLDKKIFQVDDFWLLKLMLQEDGVTPDQNHRCSNDFSRICQAGSSCDLIWMCVPGGRPIKATNVLSFDIANIGRYDAYNNLANFLVRNGYQNKVFGFAYDWRIDIEKIADDLNTAIKNSFAPNACDKVEIIAHSMGGLVARAYLRKYGNDHRINNIVFLGTPHLGTPMTYAILEGYKPLLTWFRKFFSLGLDRWFELDSQTFVSQNFSTSYQLLPQFDFILKQESNSWEAYTDSYRLLENNNPALLNGAKNKFFPLIQGSCPADIHYYSLLGTKRLCLAGFVFKKNKCIAPLVDFYSDGTVPTLSATSFGQDQYWFVAGDKSDHIWLPQNIAVQEKILAILNGQPDTAIEGVSDKPSELPDKDKKVWKNTACCPVSLLSADALGNMTGVDDNGVIHEEIPESEYFRFPENESIVTPYEGEYTLTIRGKDTGKFTLYLEVVNSENTTESEIVYADIPVASVSVGIIKLAPNILEPVLSYDVDGNGSSDFDILPQREAPEALKDLFTARGDANYDHSLDISDAITILSFLFTGNAKIACEAASDANSDNTTDISDAIFILLFLFIGDNAPVGTVFCSLNP